MLSAVTALALAATPLTLFVQKVRSDDKHAQKAKVWTQVLAEELRRRGFRVTTQDELLQLMTDAKQRQALGCDDRDCGLDTDYLNADATISAVVVDDGDYLVSLTAVRRAQFPGYSVRAERPYADPADGLRELLPKLLAQMRATALPGQIPDEQPSSAEPKGAQVNRRCAAAPGPVLLVALAALLWRRRSWKWRAGAA